MGSLRLPLRFRWTETPRTLLDVREAVLELVLRRLDDCIGASFGELKGLADWRWSLGPPRGSDGTLELEFDEAWGLLTDALAHWVTVMLRAAPATRDAFFRARGFELETPALRAPGVSFRAISQGALVTGSGPCCWLCHPPAWALDDALKGLKTREPLQFWRVQRLIGHPQPERVVDALLARRPHPEDDENLVRDFEQALAPRGPSIITAALRGAATAPRLRARQLATISHDAPDVLQALAELDVELARARERMKPVTPVELPDEPLARIVTLLHAHHRLPPETDVAAAWARCTDRELMLSLLHAGARAWLWRYEPNARRDEKGRVNDFVFATIEDGTPGRPERVRLSSQDDGAAIRKAVPTMPAAEVWNDAWWGVEQEWPRAPEQLLVEFVEDARALGTLPRWSDGRELFESAFAACLDPFVLLTVLEFVGDAELLVSAVRALASVRGPASLNMMGVANFAADNVARGRAIHQALGSVTIRAAGGRLVAVGL